MARHRTYSLEFKRLVAQQYLSGEFALAALARQHDMCRSLIRIWVAKYEAGEFDDESVQGDILARNEARIAKLERNFIFVGEDGKTPAMRLLGHCPRPSYLRRHSLAGPENSAASNAQDGNGTSRS